MFPNPSRCHCGNLCQWYLSTCQEPQDSRVTWHFCGRLHDYISISAADVFAPSESTSIPKNPRTDRPVGYAFVDLSTPNEAERAIAELSGKEILERKVSVQLARKPEPAGEKGEGAASGGEGQSGGEGARRRPSGRGRGRGRGRGGRGGRANRGVSLQA
jgi:RNA recognition motif-containing protein